MRPYIINTHERPLTGIKFNHDGDFFVSCAKDGDVCLHRTDTCERIGTYLPNGEKPSAVYAVDITMDSQYVVTANADGKLIFYEFSGETERIMQHGGILKFVEFNQKPGEQDKVVTCNDKFKSASEGQIKNRIMVWQWYPPKKLLCIEGDALMSMKATKVKWGPFDETLISIFDEGTVFIWDARDGKKKHVIEAHTGPVTSLNFSEDRSLMITSSKDQTAKLWAMDDYSLAKTYTTDRPLNDAAISPLFDAKDPRCHVILGGGQDAKDVTTTAASKGNFELLLYHMIFEEELGSVKGHFGPMNCLAWFRDGRGFITGGEDGYVRCHELDNDYFTSKKFE